MSDPIKAIRLSKTSFKAWMLVGDAQDAIRTSCQAEHVKSILLHLDDIHGEPVDVEMWINTEEAEVEIKEVDDAMVPMSADEPNPYGQVILREHALRGGEPEIPFIKGVAVLTGPHHTDFPQENTECVLAALVGRHGTDDDDA